MPGDLHCHSTFSDGSVAFDDVVELAKAAGLSALSVTDHDTLRGYYYAIEAAGRYKDEIKIIPGLELSCFDYTRKKKAHLLCYNCVHPELLVPLCDATEKSRLKSGQRLLAALQELYPIPKSFVLRHAAGSGTLYRQHIMHALMEAGFADSIYGPLYEELFNRKNGRLKTTTRYPDIYDALDAIHQAGGISVLAHPRAYDSFDLLYELCEKGLLNGVEAHHYSNRPEDTDILTQLAGNYGLIATGGSDFHGMYASRQVPVGLKTTADSEIERICNK